MPPLAGFLLANGAFNIGDAEGTLRNTNAAYPHMAGMPQSDPLGSAASL